MTPKIGRIDAKNAPSGQPTPGPGADTDATMYAIIRIASIFFHSIENKSTYQAYPVYVYYGNSDGPQLCTLCCISLRRCCFGLETRVKGNHQNFDPSSLPYKFGLIFMEMKQNNFFFEKKRIQNGRLIKTPPILNIFSGIGP